MIDYQLSIINDITMHSKLSLFTLYKLINRLMIAILLYIVCVHVHKYDEQAHIILNNSLKNKIFLYKSKR